VRLEPGLVDAYYMRGICYEAMKNNEDAIVNYQYTLELDPKHVAAQKALSSIK
jgi:tetratricopeptide (TPR) repeat protein